MAPTDETPTPHDPQTPAPPATPDGCTRCGQPKSAHRLANYADGPSIGQAFLVCETSVYRSIEDVRRGK